MASLLGLPYPGGRRSSARPRTAIPRPTHSHARSCTIASGSTFSFSGLKTAVRYQICRPGQAASVAKHRLTAQQIADLAASFQEAVVDCLVGKAAARSGKTGLSTLCVGGGVAANARLRERLADESRPPRMCELHIAPCGLCTDNAVMGAIAVERLKAGLVEPLTLDVQPGLVR